MPPAASPPTRTERLIVLDLRHYRAVLLDMDGTLLDLRYEIGSRKGERIVITDDYVQQRLSRREAGDRRQRDSA